MPLKKGESFLPIEENRKPRFCDGCDHPPESFLCTFGVLDYKRQKVNYFDFYLFDDNGRQSVCLRYGNEAHEYISPGSLFQFLKSALISHAGDNSEYDIARQILENFGVLKWVDFKE